MFTLFWDLQNQSLRNTGEGPRFSVRHCMKSWSWWFQSKCQRQLSGVMLLHDNAHPHTGYTAEKFQKLCFKILEYRPYSPDLDPSVFICLDSSTMLMRPLFCQQSLAEGWSAYMAYHLVQEKCSFMAKHTSVQCQTKCTQKLGGQ
jgi:hypothetical protein